MYSPAGAASPEYWFPQDYLQARARFRSHGETLPRDGGRTGELKIPSRSDQDLTTDYIYLPAKKNKKALLVLSSGVHGVEAFAGSAVQDFFLNRLLPDLSRDDLGILLIHAVNPYGFKYLRRVSENNVDLNRNFDTQEALFAKKNPGYSQVEGLLNPKHPVDLGGFRYYFSFVDMVWKILRHSMKPLRQAVLQGQYEFPRGLYFGGGSFEPQKELIQKLFSETAQGYGRILMIDLHTGYGEKGKLHLFGSAGLSAEEKTALQYVFSGSAIDTGDDEDFYSVHGDFTVFLGKLLPEAVAYFPMTFEFGTLDSQTYTGALKSISNMILENQGFHFGYKNPSDRETVRKRIEEMYYPRNPDWRSGVIEQTEHVLRPALQRFLQNDWPN